MCPSNLTSQQAQIAERMIVRFPTSYKGCVRLAEASLPSNPKLSLLAYARALSCNPPPTLAGRIQRRISSLRDSTSFGPTATDAELASIPESLHSALLQPFPPLPPLLWTYPTSSRERQSHLSQRLPRNFSHIYPNIAGCSTPRHEADIDTFIALASTHVLTLTAETPLPSSWFAFKPITHVYIPVDNFKSPTLAEMDVVYDRVVAGGRWVLHCGGGVGRAGTVLACLIAMLGDGDGGAEGTPESPGQGGQPRLDGRTTIALLRQARPRSLETDEQEAFVSAWVSHRWKLAAADMALEEPHTVLSYILRPPPPSQPVCLFLIGRPGSGKSWLAEVLSKRRKCIVISQDESGSRAACERELARSYPADTLVIFDRCNPRKEDRAWWLKLIDRPVVAVYFDYPKALCRRRIDSRLEHPTIRAGRGGNALDQMDRQMEPPTPDEGFDSVVTISSFPAARQSVKLFSSDPPLLKFPRTPHLLDLGACASDDEVMHGFASVRGRITIEEKIDGANMGISLDFDGAIRVQNRSHWVSSADHMQWKTLDRWIAEHDAGIRAILDRDATFPERYILYGEWCVARHSIRYGSLPDRFLAFDLYDRLTGMFVSRRVLERVLRGTGIAQVPLVAEVDELSEEDLRGLMGRTSAFGAGRVEGVYVRFEDEGRKTSMRRGKVVRGDFIAGNEHWSKGKIELNGFAAQV